MQRRWQMLESPGGRCPDPQQDGRLPAAYIRAVAREEELPLDPTCERCAAPIVDVRSSVVHDAQAYCCVNCARADAADIKVRPGGAVAGAEGACSRCGAPIVDRSHAVRESPHLFCCANCSAVGVNAEPISEA